MRGTISALILSAVTALALDPSPAGQVFEWGSTINGRSGALTTLTDAVMLSANSQWSLALRVNGSLFAWGSNGQGQTNVPSGTYTYINAGWYHGIAITNGGTVVEWGTPYGYDIGDWVALRPANLTNIVQVAAGDAHSAALTGDGVVHVWGHRSSVTNKPSLLPVNAIASGWYHMVALQNNGEVRTWGQATTGQDNTVPDAAKTDVVKVAAGFFASYAIKSDGTLVAWGLNNYGQCDVPANATNIVSVWGGRYHTIAARSDGVVLAWGSNAQGQLNIPASLTNSVHVAAGYYWSDAIQSSGGTPPGGGATIWHVSKAGNDSNNGTIDSPYLTIQRGINSALAGDTVLVQPGTYDEYLVTARTGSSGSQIRIASDGTGDVITRGVRFMANHQYVTVEGLVFETTGTSTFASFVRVEPTAHNSTVRDSVFRSTPLIIRSNWLFDHTDNSISSPSGSDWTAAGFVTGSKIFCGSVSLTPYYFANQGRAFTITGFSGSKAFVTPALNSETNLSAWSPIYAGVNYEGWDGVRMIISGGSGAANLNILNNTFSNIYGSPLYALGNGPVTYSGNRSYNTYSRAAIHPLADNMTITDNWWLNSTNWIHYSVEESASVEHGMGAQFYDYVQGHIHAGVAGTNVVIARNWLENISQPFAQIGEAQRSTNWLWSSNVVIGFRQHMGNGVNGTLIGNNTFLKVSYDRPSAHALSIGGNTPSAPVTNMWIYHNAFIDIGHHGSTNSEGFYGLVNAVSSGAYSNFVAGPESTGWQGKGAFTEATGINGGDPRLVNPQNPRGPDGIPFTDDDGLRPLPNSPLALAGVGALPPITLLSRQPVAHFSAAPQPVGWYDKIGAQFDPAWAALHPYERTGTERPYGTVDPLGPVPCDVLFDARGSISGTWSTNDWKGIQEWHWNFGDGGWAVSCQPTQSHLYLTPGTYTVQLIAINNEGNRHTNSRTYRVLDQSGFSGTIYHVKTNGNDGAAGTVAAPFATIAKALSVVIAGDYVAVHPGQYDTYSDVNRNAATLTGRITVAGYGAKIGGAKFRYPNWTYRGFEVNGTNNTAGAAFYVFQGSSNTWVLNNYIHNTPGGMFGVYSVHSSGSGTAPSAGTHNGRVIGNTFTNVGYINCSIMNGIGWLFSANRHLKSWGEGDGFRLMGDGHTVQDSYVFDLNNGGTGGHPDLWQVAALLDGSGNVIPLEIHCKNLLFQRNWVEGVKNDGGSFAVGQVATGRFGEQNWTNIVFRNNIFKNVRGALSDSIDGIKFYNNTFWHSPHATGSLTAGGGDRGSSYGTVFTNNALVGLGLTDSQTTGWYYNAASGSMATNTTVFADYNFVAGLNYGPKEPPPPHDLNHFGSNSQESNAINGGNPFFSENGVNFILAANSPLRNAGANLSSLFTDDFFGHPRPSSGAWNIGAVQFTQDSPITATPFVTVPAQTFLMGDPFDEEALETPQHQVTLTKNYRIATAPVTVAEAVRALQYAYDAGLITVTSSAVTLTSSGTHLMTLGHTWAEITFSNGIFSIRSGRDEHPVPYISWYGAAAVANWLSTLDNLTPCYSFSTWDCNFSANGYRMATEAEWECAARGGLTNQRFPWGNTIAHAYANYYATNLWSYDLSPTTGRHPAWNTQVLGSSTVRYFSSYGYGTYDMSGNVYEWVNNWNQGYTSAPKTDPTGPTSGSTKVIRGGSWYTQANKLRASNRYVGSQPQGTGHDIGFRLAQTISEPIVDTAPPTPNPMTWAQVPTATSSSSITMTATVATDVLSPPVQYLFEETTGNPGGGGTSWQLSNIHTDTGLDASTTYTYRVRARDTVGNMTNWSSEESATTSDPPPAPAGPYLNAITVNAGTLNQ
jgi:formylglycine-generating enzyme required for sulfatase activity